MKITFTEKDIKSSKYLPLGRSTVRIVEAKIGTSKAGNQVLEVMFRGIANAEGKEGREVLSLLPQTRWRLSKLFNACGYTTEQLVAGVDHSDLVGKVIELDRFIAGTEVREGKEINKYSCDFYPANADDEHADVIGSIGPSAPGDFPDFGEPA